MYCSLPGSSVHGDSPGKNTGVGCHDLLQGIFPIQGSNPGLLHCRRILYCLRHQGSPEDISSEGLLMWADPQLPPRLVYRLPPGVSCGLVSGCLSNWGQPSLVGYSGCLQHLVIRLVFSEALTGLSFLPVLLLLKWTLHPRWRASLVAQLIKSPPAMQDTPVWFLGWEDLLEKG